MSKYNIPIVARDLVRATWHLFPPAGQQGNERFRNSNSTDDWELFLELTVGSASGGTESKAASKDKGKDKSKDGDGEGEGDGDDSEDEGDASDDEEVSVTWADAMSLLSGCHRIVLAREAALASKKEGVAFIARRATADFVSGYQDEGAMRWEACSARGIVEMLESPAKAWVNGCRCCSVGLQSVC